MIATTALLAMLGLGAPLPGPWAGIHGDPPQTHIITVSMVDEGGGKWAFEPSTIHAQPGDTVRFHQTDVVPHNVQFLSVPAGAHLGSEMMGPFLLNKGDTYDLVIDARFAPGTYHFVCTPHQTMGMRGVLEVGGGGSPNGGPVQHSSRTPSGGIR